MKKYFLFIPLLVIVFLGLGNSYVSAQCEGTTSKHSSEIWDSHYFSCEVNSYSKNPACGTSGNYQQCYTPITGDSCTTYCCICIEDLTKMDLLPTQSIETTDTTPTILDERCEANEHNNAFGRCVCDDGFKKVDGECKSCSAPGVCCGIELNTKVPFIGNCIESKKEYIGGSETGVTGAEAFPTLMGALTQILVTIILIVSFVLIVVGGVMIATGNPSGGKKMIMKVVIGIALLGASGVILRLINPNFFG